MIISFAWELTTLPLTYSMPSPHSGDGIVVASESAPVRHGDGDSQSARMSKIKNDGLDQYGKV